jgi:hypothetical protein
MDRVEKKMLRRIFGPKGEGGSGGRLEHCVMSSFITCTLHQILRLSSQGG